jgi:hypothetical protein
MMLKIEMSAHKWLDSKLSKFLKEARYSVGDKGIKR